MLTKKDYIEIVKIFNNRRPFKQEDDIDIGKGIQHYDLINDFMNWLKEDNPNFNEDRFFKAIDFPEYKPVK